MTASAKRGEHREILVLPELTPKDRRRYSVRSSRCLHLPPMHWRRSSSGRVLMRRAICCGDPRGVSKQCRRKGAMLQHPGRGRSAQTFSRCSDIGDKDGDLHNIGHGTTGCFHEILNLRKIILACSYSSPATLPSLPRETMSAMYATPATIKQFDHVPSAGSKPAG